MKIYGLIGILSIILLPVIGAVHAETVTYQDVFERKPGEAGAPLGSRNIGTSKVAWEATPNVVLANGKGLRINDQAPFVGRVPLPTQFTTVTVEADIMPIHTDQGWVSLGMGNSAIDNPSFGGLFLLLRQGGLYSLMFNPDPDDARSARAIALKNGRIQTWNPDAMNRLKVVYSRESGVVSVWANGDEVLIDEISINDKNFVLDAAYAGFSGVFQFSKQRNVDKFSVTISR